jgi:subtilisin family serine protease
VTLMPGGSYDFVSGSSVATAHVSGAVALLLARRGNLDRDAVHGLLERSGRQINACVALVELAPRPAQGCTAD